jgi:hypothetical protein
MPRFVPGTLLTSGKNMSSDHTIWCDHTFSKKWTFVHTENDLFTVHVAPQHVLVTVSPNWTNAHASPSLF